MRKREDDPRADALDLMVGFVRSPFGADAERDARLIAAWRAASASEPQCSEDGQQRR